MRLLVIAPRLAVRATPPHTRTLRRWGPLTISSASDLPESEKLEFVNEDIGGHPFQGEYESLLTNFEDYSIAKEAVRNLHDTTKMDTLIKVHSGNSVIQYFQGQTNGFIISANIESDRIAFKKGIRVGMNWNEFANLFEELKDQAEVAAVVITTLEGLSYAEFSFSEGKLVGVKYATYFD